MIKIKVQLIASRNPYQLFSTIKTNTLHFEFGARRVERIKFLSANY